jgi:hypothetical protein
MRRLLGAAFAVALLTGPAEAQQTAAGAWTTAPPLPTARSEVSVAALGGTVYVVGGYAAAGAHPVALDSTGQVDVDEPLVQAFDILAVGGEYGGAVRVPATLT